MDLGDRPADHVLGPETVEALGRGLKLTMVPSSASVTITSLEEATIASK
jgi:hypothetical protein